MGSSISRLVLFPAPKKRYNGSLRDLYFIEDEDSRHYEMIWNDEQTKTEIPSYSFFGQCQTGAASNRPASLDRRLISGNSPIPLVYLSSNPEANGGYTGTARFDADVGKGFPLTWILYFHANCCDIGDMKDEIKYLKTYLNCHVILVEYPGYGITQNAGETPTGESIDRYTHRLYKKLKKANAPFQQFFVMGRSIGTGPATHFAHLVISGGSRLGGLVLHQPYSSIHKLVGDYTAIGTKVIADHWDSMRVIKKHSYLNLLLIHGENDEVIPAYHSQELYEACKVSEGYQKHYVKHKFMPHNEYYVIDDLGIPLSKFIHSVYKSKHYHKYNHVKTWYPPLTSGSFLPDCYDEPIAKNTFFKNCCAANVHEIGEETFTPDVIQFKSS